VKTKTLLQADAVAQDLVDDGAALKENDTVQQRSKCMAIRALQSPLNVMAGRP
jgi:hypothetical protein